MTEDTQKEIYLQETSIPAELLEDYTNKVLPEVQTIFGGCVSMESLPEVDQDRLNKYWNYILVCDRYYRNTTGAPLRKQHHVRIGFLSQDAIDILDPFTEQ